MTLNLVPDPFAHLDDRTRQLADEINATAAIEWHVTSVENINARRLAWTAFFSHYDKLRMQALIAADSPDVT